MKLNYSERRNEAVAVSNNNTLSGPLMGGMREVAEEFGLSYYAVRKMCLDGEIQHTRVGSKILVNRQKLYEYLNGETGATE